MTTNTAENRARFDLFVLSEHGVGNALMEYLRNFNDFSLFQARYLDGIASVKYQSKYNGLYFLDIRKYFKTLQFVAHNKPAHVCVLTRDPILQMVTVVNLLLFRCCMKLLFMSDRETILYHQLFKSSNRNEFIFGNLFRKLFFAECMFTYKILPLLKNKINEIIFTDISDLLPENIYSTMNLFKRRFFNSDIDYRKVNVSFSIHSVYSGGMFGLLPPFHYSSADMQFSLRPMPVQVLRLRNVGEDMFVSFKPQEIGWSCGKFDGDIGFSLLREKGMSRRAFGALMPRVKEICNADGKMPLTEYARKTSFLVNIVYKFFEALKTDKDEILELIRANESMLEEVKNKIYAQAAAFREFGYDVAQKWPASAELLGGREIMLTEENKYDHLHGVIKALKDELLRQGEEMENLTKEKAGLELRITNQETAVANFEKEKSKLELSIRNQEMAVRRFKKETARREKAELELKKKHSACFLSGKQKVIFRLITPIVKKLTKAANFQRFQESPALFFRALKSRKYRIFGEIFFPVEL